MLLLARKLKPWHLGSYPPCPHKALLHAVHHPKCIVDDPKSKTLPLALDRGVFPAAAIRTFMRLYETMPSSNVPWKRKG